MSFVIRFIHALYRVYNLSTAHIYSITDVYMYTYIYIHIHAYLRGTEPLHIYFTFLCFLIILLF